MQATADRPGGFLVIDKPAGVSSAKALNALKQRLPRGTKVGHAGTLDPFATGVLVALVGQATRQCERIMGLPKGYEATLRLGSTTATLDPESPEVPYLRAGATASPEGGAVSEPPALHDVLAVLQRFKGEIEQVPPAFSAVKVGGRRAYDIARGGGEVTLASRRVRLDRLELLEYEWPTLRLRIECGRGFYVRSLARDVGEGLGVGAYLTDLRRTFVGPFTTALAVPVGAEPPALLPIDWLDHAWVSLG